MENAKDPQNASTVEGRLFKSALPAPVWDAIQDGTMRSVYRGVPCLKSPFDIGIYLQLMTRLRPRTIIEIGTKFGGSALFLADMMTTHGIDGRVISIDIDSKHDLTHPRITFLQGDANHLHTTLPEDLLGSLERPLLVIEDSSHRFETSTAVLDFFDRWLVSGDYIVIEDGILSQFSGRQYEACEDGPNRAVAAFLARRSEDYAVDVSLCDHYGHNVTYNPNGWLQRR